jgi:hypothetical protein
MQQRSQLFAAGRQRKAAGSVALARERKGLFPKRTIAEAPVVD